jgi:hypothetical protein
VSRPTASKWLSELVDARVLRDFRIGRDRLFVNADFLEILVRDEPHVGAQQPNSSSPTLPTSAVAHIPEERRQLRLNTVLRR